MEAFATISAWIIPLTELGFYAYILLRIAISKSVSREICSRTYGSVLERIEMSFCAGRGKSRVARKTTQAA